MVPECQVVVVVVSINELLDPARVRENLSPIALELARSWVYGPGTPVLAPQAEAASFAPGKRNCLSSTGRRANLVS
jgi:hypothetical protein